MIDYSDVTVIIPHLGRTTEQRYALQQCLKSLNETVPGMKGWVVQNGWSAISGYNAGDICTSFQGQCKAVNAGIATTNTKWVLVVNDDMVFPPGWFERLTDTDQEYPCLSPKLIEPRPGAPTFEVFFAGGAGGDFNKEAFLKFALDYYERPGLEVRTGFNLPFLIKRDLWDMVGGYDINYDPWGSNSDSDLEYKIKLAGVQPMQNTKAIVYHFSQTSGTFNPENQAFWNKNFAYFQEKWGFPRTDDGIWEASFVIPDEGRKFRPKWEGTYAKS